MAPARDMFACGGCGTTGNCVAWRIGNPQPLCASCDEPRPRNAEELYFLQAELSRGGDGPKRDDGRVNGKVDAGKLRRLDVARMARENPPVVPWVIEGLVVRGALTVLNGREGEGKSLLAMALAAGVAHGESQAGMACRAGRALIVDTENGEHETHRRVHALGLPGSVEMYEPGDGQRFDLRSDLKDLEALLARYRPDLLVLDSFRTLWGGEENDSGDVAKVLDPLRNLVRKYEAGTILLHHSGKGRGSDYRGSSAIGSSAELGFTLARQEGDEDRDRRSLTCWKCRPAPKPPRQWLRLSVERGMVLIDEAEPPETEGQPSKPVTGSLKPRVLAALTDEPQARADIARTVGRAPKDRSVGRVLGDLACEGLARKTGSHARPFWTRAEGGNPPGPPGGVPPSPEAETRHEKRDPEDFTPEVAGGTGLRGAATCHLWEGDAATAGLPLATREQEALFARHATPESDPLDDLGPERPLPDLAADALPVKPCRCGRPIGDPDEDGDPACLRCGHRVEPA